MIWIYDELASASIIINRNSAAPPPRARSPQLHRGRRLLVSMFSSTFSDASFPEFLSSSSTPSCGAAGAGSPSLPEVCNATGSTVVSDPYTGLDEFMSMLSNYDKDAGPASPANSTTGDGIALEFMDLDLLTLPDVEFGSHSATCVVCMDRSPGAHGHFADCGHGGDLCFDCSERLDCCPLCRARKDGAPPVEETPGVCTTDAFPGLYGDTSIVEDSATMGPGGGDRSTSQEDAELPESASGAQPTRCDIEEEGSLQPSKAKTGPTRSGRRKATSRKSPLDRTKIPKSKPMAPLDSSPPGRALRIQRQANVHYVVRRLNGGSRSRRRET